MPTSAPPSAARTSDTEISSAPADSAHNTLAVPANTSTASVRRRRRREGINRYLRPDSERKLGTHSPGTFEVDRVNSVGIHPHPVFAVEEVANRSEHFGV